jgi:hypothetical protein
MAAFARLMGERDDENAVFCHDPDKHHQSDLAVAVETSAAEVNRTEGRTQPETAPLHGRKSFRPASGGQTAPPRGQVANLVHCRPLPQWALCRRNPAGMPDTKARWPRPALVWKII